MRVTLVPAITKGSRTVTFGILFGALAATVLINLIVVKFIAAREPITPDVATD